MKRITLISLLMFFCSGMPASAENLLEPDVFKQWLDGGKPVIIVDIQVPDEFQKHHFKNSIETNAFPAKTDEEKKKLDGILPVVNSSGDDVVIVCPRGGGGAKNTYDYLKTRGVSESRMHILEKGIEGWPYKEVFVQGR